MKKSSGVLLPIFALPSKFHVGSFGAEAKNMVELLAQAKQRYWQILPLSYPDKYHSPYSSLSSFAGNPALIDIETLVDYGYLNASDLAKEDLKYCQVVNYQKANKIKTKYLKLAYANFSKNADYYQFINSQKWLDDFALFICLHNLFKKPWYKWDDPLKYRDVETIENYKLRLKDKIDYQKFLQYLFYRQFFEFKQTLTAKGLFLIGDCPMYVNYDSCDVWVKPTAFLLDAEYKPLKISGVGPDYFSRQGQIWGNPLYNYAQQRQDNYSYWQEKITFMSSLYQVIRIDHFRAFDSYYALDYGAKNAKHGQWIKGEGRQLLKVITSSNSQTRFIGEDLGLITASVQKLLQEFKIPGMKVLQFAFSSDQNNPYLIENHQANCVAYLGTHDNDTTFNWYLRLDNQTQQRVNSYCHGKRENIVECLMNQLATSRAKLVIYSIQDIIGNPQAIRINTPGSTKNNWIYMLNIDSMNTNSFKHLETITKQNKRGI